MESRFMFLVSLVIINFIVQSKSQQVFVFPWPGPIAIPDPFVAIKEPDSAVVEFSDNGTRRVLQINIKVMVKLDCSNVLDSLLATVGFQAGATTTMWTRFRYNAQNDIVNTSPEVISSTDTNDQFEMSGQFDTCLNITDPQIPTSSAAENGDSGEYTCTICHVPFVLGGVPLPPTCQNETTTLLINDVPPTIDTTPGSFINVDDFQTSNIGNDICIPDPLSATGVDIRCDQDPTLIQLADTVTSWSFNGALLDLDFLSGPFFYIDISPQSRNSILSIEDPLALDPAMIIGEYVCNRTTRFGFDSERTVLGIAEDVMVSAAINGVVDDGCSRFSLPSSPGTVCAGIGETVTISCNGGTGFTITGPNAQFAMDQNLVVANIVSGDSGSYTCSNGQPCFNMSEITIIVTETGVPVIVEGLETIQTNTSTTYNISTDICILKGVPSEIVILCGHDIDSMVNPIPNAVWTIPNTVDPSATTFSDSPLRLGTNTQLTIDNDGMPIQFAEFLVGMYTCVLSNSEGSDTSTSTIFIAPNIDQGLVTDLFDTDPPEGKVTVGNSTCSTRGGDPNGALTRIECGPTDGEALGVFQTTWFRNGVLLPQTSPIITNEGSGVYTCVLSSTNCGSVNASTSLLAIPTIPTAGAPPTDSVDAQFEVGQFIRINPMVTGSAQIECPLPMFADPQYTTIMWTKEGDPNFSSSESILSLLRSDSNSAGNYTCTILSGPEGVCGMISSTSTVIIETPLETGVPVIVEGPETIQTNTSTTYNIGTDICILKGVPSEIVILCGHDIDSMVNPIPNAVWTIPNGIDSSALTFSDSPLRLGTNTQLTIDNDGMPIQFAELLVGMYTCVLSNSEGSDTSTSTIFIAPNIDQGLVTDLFDTDPPEGKVVIGNSTCSTRGGDPNGVASRIDCGSSEGEALGVFETTWFRNGVLLPQTSPIITNVGSGVYTCVLSSTNCGSVNASTSILAIPTIPTAGAPPTDSVDAQFEVGQFICLNPMVTGSAQIECPLPMFADPQYTTIMWTKEGDPNFSSSESILSLLRSESNSAGNYTCTILSGPEGVCGMVSSTSTVGIQTTLTTGTAFIADPVNNQLTIGEDSCLPMAGDSLRIRCETTPTTMVTWTLDGTSVSGDEFINVTTAGRYTCSAPDGCGQTLSESSQIFLSEMISITATLVNLTDGGNGCNRFPTVPPTAVVCPVIGETVTITCNASVSGYMIIRGGNVVSTNQSFVIPAFNVTDAGSYTCISQFQCGTTMETIEIFIPDAPPTITTPVTDPNLPPAFMNVSVGENVCLPFGESVNINCVASSGQEPIRYSWRMEPSTNVISTSNTLTVDQLGTYNCTASNLVGIDTASSTIFEDVELVFEIPQSSARSRCDDLVIPPSNTNLCFFTGDAVTLSCFSRLTMSPGIIQPGGNNGTLIIRELSETDTSFTCTSSNECGDDTATLILLVQEPARIDRTIPIPPSSDTEMNIGAGRPDEPVEVMENMTVRLHCPYTGIDEPTTRWVTVNNDRTTTDVVTMTPTVVIVNENNTIILVIMNFSEELEATYRCVTGNNAGSDDGDVVLRLDAPEPGEWTTTTWSQCNPDCHRGMRMRLVICRGVNTRMPFPDNRCTEEKPVTMERCLDRGPCFTDPLWRPQAWTACSAECGGGHRERKVLCEIPLTGMIVEDWECQQGLKPSTHEYCNLQACCTVDLYPAYCKAIIGSPLCRNKSVKALCCCSCP